MIWTLHVLLLAWLPASGSAAAYLRVSAQRPARAFYAGERVVLSLQAPGPSAFGEVTVTDYYGRQVAHTPVLVGRDVPRRLALGSGWPWGIYYLHFTFDNGQSQDDAFCVIPRPDAQPGDYGPFSWHLCSEAGDEWGALAQAGCRLVRRDIDWVNTAPAPRQTDLRKAQKFAGLAQQYGMQLIPILGYTPGWAGVKPVNAGGRAAVATHTWPPESTPAWREYLRPVVGFLGSQRVSWPAPAALRPQQANGEQSVPLVHSWEIWNEADQNFYYGHWGRYVDLLRLAYAEIKRQDPEATVLYGGSCGHWTELGLTYKMVGQFFFDRLAFHPGGENLDQAFEAYFCGAPQIGNGYGIYRPATMTEAYPYCPRGLREPQYLLRLYATLLKWRLDVFCSFDGGRIVGPPDPDSGALMWRQGPDLVPNAKYVALAVTRWLLSDAVYVGPLSLGAGVEAHLFLRHGYPLVICWADAEKPLVLRVDGKASWADEMGRQTSLAVTEGRARFRVGPAPRVLRGLHARYLAEAVGNQAELFLRTPQGFATTRGFGYIGPLESDAGWAWPEWAGAFRQALDQAKTALTDKPARAGALLGLAQSEVNAQITRVLRRCLNGGGVSSRAQATVWRLQTLSEWLGAVIDSYNERWGQYQAGPESLAELEKVLEAVEAQVVDRERGLTRPLGLQAAQRAKASLRRAQVSRGIGTFRAARGEYAAACLYARLVPWLLTGIIAAPDFLTATQLVKALALRPDQTHEIRCYVHNFTPQAVTGVLAWEVPYGWTVEPTEAPFTAPGDGLSEPVLFRLVVPGGPEPWVTRTAWPPGGPVNLRLPADMEITADLTLGGRLSDGRRLLDTPYPVLVGEYVPES